MTDDAFQRLRAVALDRGLDEASRSVAIAGLADLPSRDAVEVLLELGSRQDESDSILRAAGAALATLAGEGRVSQWDVRALADSADDAFYQ